MTFRGQWYRHRQGRPWAATHARDAAAPSGRLHLRHPDPGSGHRCRGSGDVTPGSSRPLGVGRSVADEDDALAGLADVR